MSNDTLHCLDVFIRRTLASANISEIYTNSLSEICRALQCNYGVMLRGRRDNGSFELSASFPEDGGHATDNLKDIYDCFTPRSSIPEIDGVSIKPFSDLSLMSLPPSVSTLVVKSAYSITIRWAENEYLFIVVFSEQSGLVNEVNSEFLAIAARTLLAVIKQRKQLVDKGINLRAALQAKHELIATVDALSDIICTVDVDFNIIRGNKTVESWGIGTVDNLTKKDIHDVLHSRCTLGTCELIGCLQDIRTSLLETDNSSVQVFDPCLNKHLKITARKIINPDDHLDSQIIDNSFAVVIVRDITEQVSATNLLLEYNERLTSDVKDRTTQLTRANEQLNSLTRQIFDAQENERRRISLELHDGVGQSLTAIKYFIEELIESGKESTDKSSANKLYHIVDKVKDTVEEVRQISMDLRPSILDDLGIGATISWFFREFQNMNSTITVDTDIEIDEKKISGTLATTIYRITQEATNNIVKHAHATHIDYRLHDENDLLTLAIGDNGVGLNLADGHTYDVRKGMGLIGMKERATLTGGEMRFKSQDSGGLLVCGEWRVG